MNVLRICVVLLALSTSVNAQDIDLGLDFQTNAILQLETAADGTLWGISGSAIDRLPTIAGVAAVKSTDRGATWTTSMITEDWWQWGSEIVPLSGNRAYAITLREDVQDTLRLFETLDGGTSWKLVDPTAMGLNDVHAIHFFDDNTIVAIGSHGRSIERMWKAALSTDGGLTWTLGTPLIKRMQEKLAMRNGRSIASNDKQLLLAMSSGRLISIDRTTGNLKAIQIPSPNSIWGVELDDAGTITLALQRDASNTSMWQKPKDGPWKEILVGGSFVARGIQQLADGSFAVVPWDHGGIPFKTIASDFSSVQQIEAPQSNGLVQVSMTSFIVGTELMPGKGLFLIR